MERRDFIRAAAMASATVAASRLAKGQDPPAVDPNVLAKSDKDVKWQKAPCRFCGTGCHVQVGVKAGKVVSIAGDQKAEVNRGLLCVKGYHVGLALYGKDRLTKPLLRKNGKLVPISWDEAVNVIAERVLLDPKGFAIYGSGQWTIPEGYLAQKLMKAAIANNHIDPNARLCMASAVTGFLATYGADEPAGVYDDLDKANVFVFWGNNPAEMHPVLFSRILERRTRGEDITLIDITTRRTRTSGHCQHVLTFKPHTDLAIALGIANQLIERGSYDREFVERHCNFRGDANPGTLDGDAISFDEYKKRIAEYTPEKVQEISGVPAEKIRLLADLFGRRDLRIVSTWCMGMNQHTRGTAINTLVHAVHLLSGHFGRPGDAPTSLTGQPSACGTVREVGTLAHALPGGRVIAKPEHREFCEKQWNVPAGRIKDKPGYHTVEMWKKFSTPKDKGGDIHTIWVQVTNPAQTLPNTHALVDPSRKDPEKFLIVSDVYPTATTAIADLVLPSALWVEKNGMFGNSERRTQQWFRMVKPPGEARDDVWQMLAVARRLWEKNFEGVKDKDGNYLFAIKKNGKEIAAWDWAHFYDVNVDEVLFEEYRPFSKWKHYDLAPYGEYVKARGLRWPVIEQADGSWKETRWRYAGFDDPYVKKGQDIDFYWSTTKDGKAQIWFRPYEAPPESPDKDYPFWLCTGRVVEHWHTGTMTMRIPQLQAAMPQAYLEMNRDDARRLGFSNGELVTLETRRGSLDLNVWIDGRAEPPPGSVFVPFFDEKRLINGLTLDAVDPFSKQPDYKKCAARVVKKRAEGKAG